MKPKTHFSKKAYLNLDLIGNKKDLKLSKETVEKKVHIKYRELIEIHLEKDY